MDNDLRRRRTHEIGNMGPTSGEPGKRPLVVPQASLVESEAVGEMPESEEKETEKEKETPPQQVLSTETTETLQPNSQTPPPPDNHKKPAATKKAAAPQRQLPRLDLGKKQSGNAAGGANAITADGASDPTPKNTSGNPEE